MLIPKSWLFIFAKRLYRDQKTAIPGILLRFAVTVVLGLYQDREKSHWNALAAHPELQGIYDPDIFTGERLAAKWGRISFIYQLAVLLPSIFVIAPLNIVLVVPDIVLVAFIGIAASYQKRYSTKDWATCNYPSVLSFQMPPLSVSSENFFSAAANIGISPSARDVCRSFIEGRQQSITICALVASMVFFNVAHVVYLCIKLHLVAHRQMIPHSELPIWKTMLPTALLPFRELAVWCIWVFLAVPTLLFRCLPHAFQAWTLFTARYSFKFIQAWVYQKDPSVHSDRDHLKLQAGFSYVGTRPTPLADFLSVYDVFLLVTQNLHYADVVNLSLVSKSVRYATLSPSADSYQPTYLRKYTCDPKSRRHCHICLDQTCGDCTYARSVRFPELLYDHIFFCYPYCSSCYRRTLRKHHPIRKYEHPTYYFFTDTRRCQAMKEVAFQCTAQCACHPHTPATPSPTFLQQMLYGGPLAFVTRNRQLQIRPVTRLVCRNCKLLSDEALLVKGISCIKQYMESRDSVLAGVKATSYETSEMKSGKVNLGHCASCKTVLRKGPRWWARTNALECRSAIHEPWSNSDGEDGLSGTM